MSEIVDILRGKTEPLGVVYYVDDALVTGASLTVSIVRTSDGKQLDFADATFKTSPGSPTQALTESPSGTYEWVWDTSTITNPVAAGTGESYLCTLYDATNARNVVGYELRVRAVDAVHTLAAAGATASALSTAQADLTAIKGTGFTTGDDLHAIRARGDSAWTTAVGFAVAGDAMTLTIGERSSVGTAVWATATRTITGTASGALTSSSFATGALGSVWDEATASHSTAGTFGLFFTTQLDATTGSRLAAAAYSAPPSASTISAAVVDQALSGHTTTGSVGAALVHLDADISSRLASASYTAPPSASAIASQVDTTLSGTHGAGAWGSTGGLTVQEIVDGVWNEATSAHSTAGSFAALVKANLDAAVSTRLASSSYTAPPSASTVSAAVWAEATRTLTAATNLSALASQASVDAVASAVAAIPTRTPLDAAGTAAAVWGALVASYSSASTFGALLGTNVDATISSRSTLAAGAQMTLTAGAITAVQSGLATAAAVAAIPTTAAPTAAAVSSQVAADLATAHGAGAWTTANVASLATTAQLGTTQTAIIAAMPAAAPTASAVAAAVASLSLASYTDATTLGGAVRVTRIFSTWTPVTLTKKTYNALTGKIDVYGDDGATVLYSVPIRDYLGAAVAPAAGEPYQLG